MIIDILTVTIQRSGEREKTLNAKIVLVRGLLFAVR